MATAAPRPGTATAHAESRVPYLIAILSQWPLAERRARGPLQRVLIRNASEISSTSERQCPSEPKNSSSVGHWLTRCSAAQNVCACVGERGYFRRSWIGLEDCVTALTTCANKTQKQWNTQAHTTNNTANKCKSIPRLWVNTRTHSDESEKSRSKHFGTVVWEGGGPGYPLKNIHCRK